MCKELIVVGVKDKLTFFDQIPVGIEIGTPRLLTGDIVIYDDGNWYKKLEPTNE